MKNRIFTALAVVLFIGIAGCNGSTSTDNLEVSDILQEEGGTEISNGWWSDEEAENNSEGEEDQTADDVIDSDTSNGNTENTNHHNESKSNTSNECGFDAHSIDVNGETTVDINGFMDVEISVSGGSGNFKWYTPSTSDLPEGMYFEGGEIKSHITGTPTESGTFDLAVKVRDLDCEHSITSKFTIGVRGFEKTHNSTAFETFTPNDDNAYAPTKITTVDLNSTPNDDDRITKILIHLTTRDAKRAGTDTAVYIYFCSDREFTDCKIEKHKLDNNSIDDHGRNSTSTHIIDSIDLSMEDVQYFKIKVRREFDKWILNGIKVEHVITQKSEGASTGYKHLAYWNPCVHHMFRHDGHQELMFGPDDTAVCSIIETGTKKNAGTHDDVNLEFIDTYTNDATLSGPSLDKFAANDGFPRFQPNAQELTLDMEWRNYNDFENGRITSYGAHLFDSNPFIESEGIPGEYRIKKSTDGWHGGWHLFHVSTYVYWPAKNFKYDNCAANANDCTASLAEVLYYDHYKFDDYLQQGGKAENNNTLFTKNRSLDELEEWDDEIFDESDFNRMGDWK